MKPQKLMVVFASLLLCSTFGWTQSPFTNVSGNAAAGTCPLQQYDIDGTGDLSDHISINCPDNGFTDSASISSQASLDTQEVALASTKNFGVAKSGATGRQTAKLIPPKGFNGNKVQASYSDTYAINLSGVGTKSQGAVSVCWLLISQLKFQSCQERTTNGKSGGVVHHIFVLTKSQSGFQLTITKGVAVSVVSLAKGLATSGGTITTATPHLILPQGWTCKYDSGTKCP